MQRSRCESKVSSDAQRQVRLSEEQRIELIDQYGRGVSVVRLAEIFGVHKTTVSGHLRRAGVKVRGSQRSLSTQQEAEAARLYADEGLTLAELGERFSVGSSTIRDCLARQSVCVRSRGRRST